MKRDHEMQGPEFIPEDTSDAIFVLDQNGKMVELEIEDDPEEVSEKC